MEGLAYVEGAVVDLADAHVPLNDRGFLLGDGLFETLRTCNGELFCRELHTQRLRRGLRALGLEPDLSASFDAALDALVAAGQEAFADDLYLRINVTTGVMEDIAGDGQGVAMTGIAKRFRPYPMQYYAQGVHLIPSRIQVQQDSPLAGLKTLSFLPYIAARREAMAATAHDGVLRNSAGRIAEATTSNIFARSGDTIFAPGAEEGAVDGVTRQVVLQLIEDTGLEVIHSMEEQALISAQEAWVTNTTGGVVPVTRYDDRPIGDGKKGRFTTRLGHAFEDLLRGR